MLLRKSQLQEEPVWEGGKSHLILHLYISDSRREKDQKLAAIITPPVKPKEQSKNFLLEDLKIKTNPAPRAVSIHVNKPPKSACNIGDCTINQL